MANAVDIIIRAKDAGVKAAFGTVVDGAKRSKLALDAFNQTIKKTNRASSEMSSRVKGAFAGIGAGVVTQQLFDAGLQAERLELAFVAITRSSQGAATELAFVRKEADRLGLSFYSTADSYKAILAAGLAGGMSLEDTRRIFVGISEASMALGLNNEQVIGTFKAIGQMMGKQKVLAEEIRQQLGEKMPTAIADFAQSAGKSVGEFEEMMARGEVRMDILLKTMNLWSTRYGKDAEDAAQKAVGALGRWKTAWWDLKVLLANSGFLSEATKNLKRLTSYLKDPEVQKAIQVWAEKFFALSGAIIDITWNWKNFIIAFGGISVALSIFTKLLVVVRALHTAFLVLTGVHVVQWLGIATAGFSVMQVAALGLKFAMLALVGVFVAWEVGWKIGGLLNKFKIVRKAALGMIHGVTTSILKARIQLNEWQRDTKEGDALKRQLAIYEQTYRQMIAEIDGVKTAGVKAHTEIADSAEKGAKKGKYAVITATDDQKKAYKKYVDEVKRLQAEIALGEQSLAEELRAMKRSGMSELGSWRDRRAEAASFYDMAKKASIEAEKAAGAGDTTRALELSKEAKRLAGKAKDAAKDLNTEVKAGEKTLISKQKALQIAYAEAKKYGELEIEIQKKMVSINQAAADKVNKESGFAFAKKELKEIDTATDKYARITVLSVGKSYELVWDNAAKQGKAMIKEVEAATSALVNKKRTIKIDVDVNTSKVAKVFKGSNYYVEAKRQGGVVGMAKKMAVGGMNAVRSALDGFHFAGYGGGDQPKNLVMAENGEVMIRKEMVKKAGLKAALAFNAGRFDVLLAELMKKFAPGQIMMRAMGGLIAPQQPMLQAPAAMASFSQSRPVDSMDLNFNLPVPGRSIRGSFGRGDAHEFVRQVNELVESSS